MAIRSLITLDKSCPRNSRILRSRSPNALTLSLWSLDSSGASIAGLELITDGAFSTGLDIADYIDAPDYAEQRAARPLPKVTDPM